MKVVITDYPDTMGRNLAYEEAILKRGFPGCETICYLYRGDKEEMKRLVCLLYTSPSPRDRG